MEAITLRELLEAAMDTEVSEADFRGLLELVEREEKVKKKKRSSLTRSSGPSRRAVPLRKSEKALPPDAGSQH